ncbi:MAG: transglutaminase-like domain-containing protein [Firmicutes bacterium]|nr:transglutaminase-like domain-containing protein [[Eubacterium] siraeum]MCM1487537.1 transglutaminase-like domain-containing protein [Bacillota bacterium]
MKKKTKLQPSFAVYNFPYFRKSRSYFRIFSAKAILIAVTSGAGAYYFTTELKLPDMAFLAALAAGIASLAYFVLLNLYRQLYVNLFTAGACGIIGLFFRGNLYESGEQFIYQVLIASNGKIVDTSVLTANCKDPDSGPFMILLCIVFGIICAYSFYHRCHLEGALAFGSIMLVPSFLSLSAGYHFSLAVFAAGCLGLWVMSSSLHLNSLLMVGGPVNTYAMDGEYRRLNKKLSLKNRLKEDSFSYGRYFQDAFMTAVIALLTVSITASAFPTSDSLKFEEVIKKVTESFQSMDGWGIDIFPSLGFGGSTFSGYFSADGGNVSISNSIEHDNGSKRTKPVLEVIAQNTDKLYLKGDICCKFDGKNWESISKTDFSKIYYQKNGSTDPVELLFQSYIPELMLLNARSSLYGSNPDSVVGSQTVKINYLTKMNTVLFPGTPFIYNFRDNKDFTAKGDFVALADRGKINSMETAVLYPKNGLAAQELVSAVEEADPDSISYLNGLSVQDYANYAGSYTDFVNSYYTDVPEDEAPYMLRFLLDCFNGTLAGGEYINAEGIRSDYTETEIAEIVSNYLSAYGGFRYSLTADNFKDGKSAIGTFITETKAGHCAMYASTMCLALRYLGIPARYVTGFTVGEGKPYQETDGGFKYTLAGKDLHAWVEVYFDQVGWLPYDPTPSSYMNYDPAAEPIIAVTSTQTSAAESGTEVTTTSVSGETTTAASAEISTAQSGDSPAFSSAAEEEDKPVDYTALKTILIILGSIAAVIAAVLAVRSGLKALSRKEKALFKFFKNGEGAKAARKMLNLSLRLMKIKGITRKNGETPEEFGTRADDALKLGGMLKNTIPLFEREEFDASPEFTEEEQKQLYIFTKKLTKTVLGDMKNPMRLITRIILFGRGKSEYERKKL